MLVWKDLRDFSRSIMLLNPACNMFTSYHGCPVPGSVSILLNLLSQPSLAASLDLCSQSVAENQTNW